MSTDNADDIITNRSDVTVLTDARLANPNGDPRSAEDKPRRDSENRGIITDSRFKRNLRDQLSEDGLGVLLENPKFIDEGVSTRPELYRRLLDVDDEELEDLDEEELRDRFFERATDVRMFGATVSLPNDNDTPDDILNVRNSLDSQYIGPIQFMHGESLHQVFLNDESSKLAITLSSDEDNEQGTFGYDHRIRYGLYRFYGVINENAAHNTGLTNDDVKRMDSLVWKSWRNQTLTRNKLGQELRLYARVEYETDSFHIGPDLELGFELSDETDDPREFADITDVTLDSSLFLDLIEDAEAHIKTVHLVESPLLQFENCDSLTEALGDILGDDRINEIDPRTAGGAQ